MKNDRLNKKSLDEMIDMHIGREGTEKRDSTLLRKNYV